MPAISAALVARLRAADPAADRDLLRAFLADRSEPAFAALVRRHGPMVLGVCRRVLGNPHDADDAFQATFLVLARKASAVGRPDRLPGWLHTIAVRTATEVRRMRDRRRKIEASGGRQSPEWTSRSPEQSELAALLDEELANLPEHYRVPVVLCELQGLPRKEAAVRLKLSEGTLSSRLAKARKLLADRLARRGVTATATTITAALARDAAATVSAGLAVEAARTALTSAASAVAAHAADGVVKALLVSKLKGLALAVGVAVACAGGVATLPVGAGASGAPLPAEPKPEALVRQLGSDSFADRNAAEKKLRAMGARALPAVSAGMTDPDAEVARRCRAIAVALRADTRTEFAREFRADGTGTFTHPVWKRYRAIAGDSAAARKLFAAIIADKERFKRLDEAEADPKSAGEVYKAEVAAVMWVALESDGPQSPPLADIAACLLLGSYEATAKAVPPRPEMMPCAERHALLGPPLWSKDALNGPNREPVARLYAAWCDRRGNADVLQWGLDRAINWRIKETLPTARRVARDDKAATTLRLSALSLLAYFGTEADDAPAAEALMDDTAVIHTAVYDGVRYVAQVRDVATAVRVKLAGRDPESLGFRTLTGTAFDWTQTPIPAANAFPRGFPTDAARDTAHEKARAFLDDRPKPDPKPDPEAEKLVKQLGSPNFADRDAAEKRLKELGPRAKAAVLAGAKDPDPEIAHRCAAILRHVREAERQAFLAGKAEASPAWKRFKELVGDTKASRELYAEMTADERRAELVEKAEASPAKAAEVYAAEVTRAADASLKAFQLFVGQVAAVPAPGQSDPKADASRKAVPLGDVVAVLFLGARPLPAGAKDPSASWALRASFADGVGGPHQEPFRKLFAAWLDRRTDPETLRGGLETALFAGVPDALPTARRLAADPKLPAPAKGLALVVVGNHGTKDDLPLLTACRADARVSSTYKTIRKEVHDTQVRDVAAAMALHLSGQDFNRFGFPGAEWQVWWLPSNPAPFKGITQFETTTTRDAAHKQAWWWLGSRPIPGTKR